MAEKLNESPNEMVEKLFGVYKVAMHIATDLVNGTYEEETIHDLLKDIAYDIAGVMNILEKQCGIKVPENIWKEMEKIDEEHEKAVERWTG